MENLYRELLRWPAREQARYPRGLFDGEGGPRYYRYKKKRGHHVPGEPHVRAIDLANSDKSLLITTQEMLMNLGIRSRIYLDVRKGERKATIDNWRLKVLDRDSMFRFAQLIGFTNSKKIEVLQQLLASYRELGS